MTELLIQITRECTRLVIFWRVCIRAMLIWNIRPNGNSRKDKEEWEAVLRQNPLFKADFDKMDELRKVDYEAKPR